MFNRLFGKKPPTTPKVRLMGMNERGLNLFTMFLNGPAKGLCEIVNNGSHEIVIIDLDAMDNTRLWLDMRREFHGPAIVLSVTKRDLGNAYWVSKPVQPEQFKLALEQAKRALVEPPAKAPQQEAAPVKPQSRSPSQTEVPPPISPTPKSPPLAARPAIEPAAPLTAAAATGMNESMDERALSCCGDLVDEVYRDPGRREQLFFDSKDSVLGVLKHARTLTMESGIARIAREGAHPLYVGFAQDFVSSPMQEAYLRAICARNIGESPVKVELVDLDAKIIGESDDIRMRRLDNVLWKTALWSSRGRVEVGTSLDAPVRLRAWPNIPRLMGVPHSLRIAALWVSQPTSLLETARKLNVPHRYVFSFYCACNAFDLVEQLGVDTSASAKQVAAKAMTQEKRGLFGSLLKKLGF